MLFHYYLSKGVSNDLGASVRQDKYKYLYPCKL